MSDWQPAILKPAGVHANEFDGKHGERHATAPGKLSNPANRLVRIRPAPDWLGSSYCTEPGMFFEIHPEDARVKLGVTDGMRSIVCEHQILTD